MRSAYLYRLILRLHPADFRKQFARDMELDFQDAMHTYGLPHLWRDLVLSLARQWTARIFTVASKPVAVSTPSLLAGDYIMIRDQPFTPLELLRGLTASATLFTICVSMLPTHAQILHATAPLPTFEVATLKPWQRPPAPPPPPPGSEEANPPKPAGPAKIAPGKPGGQSSDRVHSILPVRLLIAFAYNIPFGAENARVLGGPDWVSSDQYELQAKIEDSLYAAMQKMTAPQQREQVDLMEQSLLADRFKLKIHLETRDMPAYVLTIANGGPKLTPAKDGETTRLSMSGNVMTATAVTLDDWAQSPFLNGRRAIVNQTGLQGKFDFTLTWTPDQLAPANAAANIQDDAPPLLTAIQQQLGLRLVPTKAPVEVIIIDHIERPSEN